MADQWHCQSFWITSSNDPLFLDSLSYNQQAHSDNIGYDSWANINARGMQTSPSVSSALLQMPHVWSGTISATAEYSNLPGILSSINSNIGRSFIPGINEYEDTGNNIQLCLQPAGVSSLEIEISTERSHETGAATNPAVSSSSKEGHQDSSTKTCQFCHRTFSRPSTLKIHVNSHTGSKPFQCPVHGCGRAYLTNSNVNRHIRKYHGVDALEAIRQAPTYGSQFKYEKFSKVSRAPCRELRWTTKEQDGLFIHPNPSSLALASC